MAANGLNREDYTESLFQANTWQGKLLGIPLGVNTTAVFYNKDMFEAAGVNYPSDEMTWDDAISMAQDIVGHFNPSGEIKVWGFNTHTYLPTRLGFLYGGTITTDGEIATDREVAIETTRHLHDAWAKHQVSPTGDQLKELGDYWGQTVFAQGHVAMHPAAPSLSNRIEWKMRNSRWVWQRCRIPWLATRRSVALSTARKRSA